MSKTDQTASGTCCHCHGAKFLHLEICCNDPDNGSPLGRSETVQITNGKFGSFDTTLEGPPIVTRREDGYLQFSRFRIPFRSYREWFGNWCWDVALVTREQGRRAAIILLQRGWTITEGPEAIYNCKKPLDLTKALWDSEQCSNCHGTGKEPEEAPRG